MENEIKKVKRRTMAQETWHRLIKNKGAVAGMVFLAVLIAAALLSAIPLPIVGKDKPQRQLIKGEITSPVNLPDECRFGKRCDYTSDVCKQCNPKLVEVRPNHFVACAKWADFSVAK